MDYKPLMGQIQITSHMLPLVSDNEKPLVAPRRLTIFVANFHGKIAAFLARFGFNTASIGFGD